TPAGAAQLRDEDGGAERPIIPQRADPDAEDPGTVTRDVQADDPGLFVLEVGRGVIVFRTNYRAEVDRLLPTEIVMLVASSRNIEIVAAETTWAVTVEEQQMPVRRKARDGRAAIDAIDDGYTVERIQIYWWSPTRVEAGALGNPDFEEASGVLAVDTPWTVRTDVQAQAILRDRGVAVEVLCVDHGAEVDWRGPRPKRAEPFIVIVTVCEYRGWAQGHGESKRSSTLEESPARHSS